MLCRVRDGNGKTPADLADANHKQEVAALLRGKEGAAEGVQ